VRADPPGDDPALAVLTEWRAGVALEMGVPPFLVLSDAVLRAILAARPESRLDLARIRGVGPRALAKFADDILRLVGVVCSDVPGSGESGSLAPAQKNAVPSQDTPASLTKLR
jgi:ATP-dependent DNA helicase RecQ